MDVININGRRLGYIQDILIDFNKRKVIGFNLTSTSFLKKNLNIMLNDVVSYNSTMVVTETIKGVFLQFDDIKGMDIRDRKGSIIGMIEDILFDERKFSISAVVVSTGFITNFIQGKKIVLIKELILGEESILFNGKSGSLNFSSVPHKLFMEDDINEKDKKDL